MRVVDLFFRNNGTQFLDCIPLFRSLSPSIARVMLLPLYLKAKLPESSCVSIVVDNAKTHDTRGVHRNASPKRTTSEPLHQMRKTRQEEPSRPGIKRSPSAPPLLLSSASRWDSELAPSMASGVSISSNTSRAPGRSRVDSAPVLSSRVLSPRSPSRPSIYRNASMPSSTWP
jgi:hypothetical protein